MRLLLTAFAFAAVLSAQPIDLESAPFSKCLTLPEVDGMVCRANDLRYKPSFAQRITMDDSGGSFGAILEYSRVNGWMVVARKKASHSYATTINAHGWTCLDGDCKVDGFVPAPRERARTENYIGPRLDIKFITEWAHDVPGTYLVVVPLKDGNEHVLEVVAMDRIDALEKAGIIVLDGAGIIKRAKERRCFCCNLAECDEKGDKK